MLQVVVVMALMALLSSPGQDWSVAPEPSLVIGEASGPDEVLLYGVTHAIRLSDGRIAVANAGSGEVRIFNADGRFLASHGSEAGPDGTGPGEYKRITHLQVGPPDNLVVEDGGERRYSLISAEGDFLESYRARPGDFAMSAGLLPLAFVSGAASDLMRESVAQLLTRLGDPPDGAYRLVRTIRNEIWVSTRGDAMDANRWVVYDGGERVLGQVTIPDGLDLYDAGEDFILGLQLGDSDVERVALYQLRRTPAEPSAAPRGASTGNRPFSDRAEVRATVRNFAVVQEMHFARQGRYSDTPADLIPELPDRLRATSVGWSPRGWAIVVYSSRSGAVCGMGVGLATPAGWTPGEVVCSP